MANPKSTTHPALAAPRHFTAWMSMVIAAFSVAAGYLLFVAIHAYTAAPVSVTVHVYDANDNPLSGVQVGFAANTNLTNCYDGSSQNLSTSTSNASGTFTVKCSATNNQNYGTLTITSVVYSGDEVCSCSYIQVGSSVNVSGGQQATYDGNQALRLEQIAPPPSPSPPPTSPTPSPPSGTSKSTTTHSSSSTTSTSTSSSSTTPSTTSTTTTTTSDGTGTPDFSANASDSVLADTPSTISSSDGRAVAIFPAGTFKVDASCQLNPIKSAGVPTSSKSLVGPYIITCKDQQGHTLSKLYHAVSISVSVPKSTGYLVYVKGNTWGKVAATSGNNSISFQMMTLAAFAAASTGTNWTPILLVVGAFALLVFGAGGGLLILVRHRRQQAEYEAYIRHRYIDHDAKAKPPV